MGERRILTTWDWRLDPVAPRAWPNPERRVMLLARDLWAGPPDVENGRAARFITELISLGAMVVQPTFHPETMRCYPGIPIAPWFVPALLARTRAELDAGLPELLRIPAQQRALLLEPTEAIDLSPLLEVAPARGGGYFSLDDGESGEPGAGTRPISWVIVRGSETPLTPTWVRSIRDQCAAAGVPFAFLGWGDWVPFDEASVGHDHITEEERGRLGGSVVWTDGRVRLTSALLGDEDIRIEVFGPPTQAYRVGSARSGRLLDDREHLASPWGDIEVEV